MVTIVGYGRMWRVIKEKFEAFRVLSGGEKSAMFRL